MKHDDILKFLNINWLVRRISEPSTASLFLPVYFVSVRWDSSDFLPRLRHLEKQLQDTACCWWIWTNQRIQESDGMWRYPGFFHIFPGPFWCLYTAPKGAYEMMVISRGNPKIFKNPMKKMDVPQDCAREMLHPQEAEVEV